MIYKPCSIDDDVNDDVNDDDHDVQCYHSMFNVIIQCLMLSFNVHV